jgi:hypothetical protein
LDLNASGLAKQVAGFLLDSVGLAIGLLASVLGFNLGAEIDRLIGKLKAKVNQLIQKVADKLRGKKQAKPGAGCAFVPKLKGSLSSGKGQPGMGGGGCGNCFAAGTAIHRGASGTTAIEQVRLGQRVRTDLACGESLADTTIDPASWRVIRLRWEDPEGWVEADLLRGPDWFGQLGAAQVGDTIELNLPEMGCEGQASIVAIEPCPELELGSGRLVTGLFRHSAGQLYDLSLDGSGDPIGITALHPVWSVDARAWISASELVAGARLTGLTGEAILRTMLPRDIEPVYNIEVDADHCYRVGEQGLLVHNASEYYRGDESGLKRILSHLAKSDGIPAARAEFGRAKTDGEVDAWFALHAEESEDLEELNNSPFVSVTKSYEVACYFATSQGSGSVYVLELEEGKRVRKNRHNKKWIEIGGRRYPEREYLVPVYIRTNEIVRED